MPSSTRVIVTPKVIWRHNVGCWGRFLLWIGAIGTLAVILFSLGWFLCRVWTGVYELTLSAAIFSSLLVLAFFLLGQRRLGKRGAIDWSMVTQKADSPGEIRIGGKGDFGNAEIGQAFFNLLFSGPDWFEHSRRELRSTIRPSEENAERLEALRRHAAARDSWVALDDFRVHEEDLYLLAQLEMLSIRESAGRYYFHVTVQGSTKWTEVKETHPLDE